MEGIPVKISEKYKPPRKITLPSSIQNKLNTKLKLEKYDFELEHLVLEEMGKLKERQKKLSESKSSEESPPPVKLDENTSPNYILLPTPSKPYVQPVSSHQMGRINISDFENDTSSPFDSVELKTLNDMEELAHVLGGSGLSSPRLQNGGIPSSGSYPPAAAPALHYPPPAAAPPPQIPPREKASSPGMAERSEDETGVRLQNLQKRIEERRAAETKRNQLEESSSGLSIAEGGELSLGEEEGGADTGRQEKDSLPNPLPTLSPACQSLARRMGEMGFPLSRAARATQIYGPNETKVIELLLEVQSLEEAGYPGERAERAFVLSNYSREDALKFLDNIAQIMKLGFKEEEVIGALVKSGFDRDTALEALLS